MNVKELAEKIGAKVLVDGDNEAEVQNCYCGDLLSWVMSKAKEGDAWLTVMGNINAVAVAVLTECACIILTENAPLDENAREKATEQKIYILQSSKDAYTLAVEISQLL